MHACTLYSRAGHSVRNSDKFIFLQWHIIKYATFDMEPHSDFVDIKIVLYHGVFMSIFYPKMFFFQKTTTTGSQEL